MTVVILYALSYNKTFSTRLLYSLEVMRTEP